MSVKANFKAKHLTDIILIALFGLAILTAWGWPTQSRMLPLIIAISGLSLSIVQMSRDLRSGVELPPEHRKSLDHPFWGPTRFFGWIFGFTLCIWFLGFLISVPLFLFSYIKFQGRQSWFLSSCLAIFVTLFVWGIFDQILHVPWPEGITLNDR
jgi:hypothetical protein